ncbi:MAG TPA: cytosine permease [Actinomycetota bacterium]|nr:cytosine permease [Actinomycetota bacterium]
MATVTERLERVLEREAPTWGVRPVPPEHRRLGGVDFAVLWGDLAIGLLVMLTGTFLVLPAELGGFGLGLPEALLAVAVGSLVGCVPLALVGLAGAREGVPGMVLFRPVLGLRGSYLPSVLNVAQLVGWTGFEFWVMALVADQVSARLFGFRSYWFWLAVVAVVCTALALGGPILVVRRWLERFGVWVLAGAAGWITFATLTASDLGSLWSRPGTGGVPFWLAVDLVIVMPVSWLPLVADYNRFARGAWSSAGGTFAGYALGNVWLYALGALLAAGVGLAAPAPGPLGQAIAALAGGGAVLLALLVGETDEAFADIYSAAVSSQNVVERLPQRGAVVAVAAVGAALAAWLGLAESSTLVYESFLFLLGSVFVPLFGVFVADYFVLRGGGGEASVGGGRAALPAFAAWGLGFLVYHWSVPVGPRAWVEGVRGFFEGLGLPFPLWGSVAGASLPAFGAALVGYLALAPLRRALRARQ